MNLKIPAICEKTDLYIVSYFDPIFRETRSTQTDKAGLQDLEAILDKARVSDVKMWKISIEVEPITPSTYQKIVLSS